jgi:hypothetical protein
MFAASFDIGKCNFAFYIEEFNENDLLSLQAIPKNARYNPDGSCKEEFTALIQSVYMNGTKVLFRNLDLTENTDKSKYLDTKIYMNMIKAMDEYKEFFDKCSIIVIEQQMSFKAAQNTMALKLGQQCFSYFLFRYGEEKEIIEFPAYYKTQILGAPKVASSSNGKLKAMSKPDRKKWSVEKAVEILLERGDVESVEELTKKRKRDDMADVLIQLQSFKFLRFVDKSI